MEKEIAELTGIILQKEIINELGIFIYKPVDVIDGKFQLNEKGEYDFIDNEGEKHLLVTDSEMTDPKNRFGIGYVIKNKSLEEQYKGYDIYSAQNAYFNCCKDQLGIGFPMPQFNKTAFATVDLGILYNQLHDLYTVRSNPKLLEKVKQKEEQLKKDIENQKNASNINEDLRLIIDYLLLSIDDMLKMNNIDKIKDVLKDLSEAIKLDLEEINKEENLNKGEDIKTTTKEDEDMETKKTQEYYDEMNWEEDKVDPLNFDAEELKKTLKSKIIDRNFQIDKIVDAIKYSDTVNNANKREFVIIAGTTGTGKTQTYTELKNALNTRPVIVVDTNQLTEEGYVGGKLENLAIEKALKKAKEINGNKTPVYANEDIKLAERSIIILDEIDKRVDKGNGDNVNKEPVIHELLTFLDGNSYDVPVSLPGNKKGKITVPTDKMIIMASGAFQEYFNKKNKNENKREKILGFQTTQTTTKKVEENDLSKYLEVNPNDLIDFGLSEEFIGRFSKVILYPSHTKETLAKLERNINTSAIYSKIKLFEEKGVKTVLGNDFIETVANEASKFNTGGRAVKNIIARITDGIDSHIKSNPDTYYMVYLSAKCVENPDYATLIKFDNTFTTMKEINEEKMKENAQIQNTQEFTQNVEDVKFVENVLGFDYDQKIEEKIKAKKLTK